MDRPERKALIEKLEADYGLQRGHMDTETDILLRIISAMHRVIRQLADGAGIAL